MPESRRRGIPQDYSVAEIHAHTLFSDGMVTPVELVEAAAKIGLSVLCITDHDTIGGLDAAIELGAKLGIDVVRGEEVTTNFPPGIHILGLFLQRPIRMHMSLEDTVDAIHDQGGLAVIAHPAMPTYFASASTARMRRLLDTHAVDGIEIRHTAPMLARNWHQLDCFYAENKPGLGAALGSGDSHFGSHDLGRLVTLFPGRGAAALRQAIEARTTSPFRFVATAGAPLSLRLRQQYRSLIWLPQQRRQGKVGQGADDTIDPAPV